MENNKLVILKSKFDEIVHLTEDGIEFWLARELQSLLGYSEWRNFEKIIKKAKETCSNSKFNIFDHFVDVNKMVKAGVAIKPVLDYQLTRYACYLIAQNGDPKKEEVAFAQSYFAIQTRKLELREERVEEKDLYGENPIATEHIQNNTSVRDMLIRRGIKPETLPASEDMKKIERKLNKTDKKLAETSGKLNRKDVKKGI